MIGERLGSYRVERELGTGGMGKVYAATVAEKTPGLETGATVALKVVHPHLLESPGFFRRFVREADLGASIQHVNVVRTYLCDQVFEGGKPSAFLVMEYVEGQNLRDLLRELDKVPEELCRHVGREISRGLVAIHAAGVVHRDLKPENVLITDAHDVKVMDLGVARLADEQMRLSQSGAFVGSVEYAAPEQFEGGEVDARCDLHALGLLLYELACGQHPYRGDDFRGVMKRVCSEAPRRAGEVHPQLSPFFEEVVHTLLAKQREDRFASAVELLAVLEEGEQSEWWREREKQLRAASSRPLRRVRIPRETAVYGRDKELDKLRGLFAQAKAGEGHVVLVEGEAGIGKSRLVDELVGRLQSEGEDINFLFGSYPPGGAATASGAFSTAYREHFGSTGCSEYLQATPILVPAFDALLKGESAPTGAEPLTKDSLQTCFVNVTRALSEERPTVVLIDDLHFAPDEGRALFTSLAMAVPGERTLLVGTTRPGVSDDWMAGLSRLAQTSHIGLSRLGPKDLAGLLQDSFKSEQLAHALGVQVGLKSDGNPFFAFEIIRGLREGQFITQKDDGTWVSTQIIDEIQIPSSVLDLVNARVADLTDDEKDMLEVAACCGFEFDPTLVADVCGIGAIPALKQLGRIEKKHRLIRAAGRRYAFDHHQVQEALYQGLHETLREHYHAGIGDALERTSKAADADPEKLDGELCVDLCEHFLSGAQGERAVRYLAAASAHMRSGYLHAHVVTLTERALAIPGLLTGIERAKTLLRLCNVNGPLDSMGRATRQEECAREAETLAAEASDEKLQGNAANALGWSLYRTSRQEHAEAAYRRALELARSLGDKKAEAAATLNLGSVFWSLGRLPEAREHMERSLALSRELGDRRGEASATGNLGLVFKSLGRLPEAREHIERYLALSRELGDRSREGAATGNLGGVFQSLGRLPEAREHHERALALNREIGSRAGEAIATGNLGVVFQSLGRLPEAREHMERHLALSREIGRREGEAVAQHNLGAVLREEGERAGSEERLQACLVVCAEIGHRHLAAGTHLALGSLRATQSRSDGGDEEGGRESLAAARDLSVECGFVAQETLARCELALLPGGDAADALAAFTEHDERLAADERLEARLLLWKATGDRTHLEEAKRLLDESLANVASEYHESMLTNVRLNREIMAAWRGESEASDGPDDDEPRGTESITRAGQ